MESGTGPSWCLTQTLDNYQCHSPLGVSFLHIKLLLKEPLVYQDQQSSYYLSLGSLCTLGYKWKLSPVRFLSFLQSGSYVINESKGQRSKECR